MYIVWSKYISSGDLDYTIWFIWSFAYMEFQWRNKNLSGFMKNVFIYILKMNVSLTGL